MHHGRPLDAVRDTAEHASTVYARVTDSTSGHLAGKRVYVDYRGIGRGPSRLRLKIVTLAWASWGASATLLMPEHDALAYSDRCFRRHRAHEANATAHRSDAVAAREKERHSECRDACETTGH
jgi:hypothetical protein